MKNNKLTYEVPETEVWELVTENVLNGSPGNVTENVTITDPFDEEGEDW